MKELNVKVLSQKGNQENNPLKGILLVESNYRMVNIEKIIEATKKSIIMMIEKIEGEVIPWLKDRIEYIMSEMKGEGFYIGDNYYSFNE